MAVDWVGTANEGWDQWRAALAQAANTTPDHVSVHTLHQHDAPGYDPEVERLLESRGIKNQTTDMAFATQTIPKTADPVRQAMGKQQKISRIRTGQAQVNKVASNGRILGPMARSSICAIARAGFRRQSLRRKG